MIRKLLSVALVLLALTAATVRASIYTRQVTVLSTATRLDANTSGERILLVNQGAGSVFLGDSSVTTSTGVELKSGASLALSLTSGEQLYGRVASTTYRVDVLENGR